MPDPSPFVLKVDAYLRMAGIEHELKPGLGNMKKAPKGKLPFISHNGKTVADSQFICDYLKREFGDKLDQQLTAEQKAIAYLVTKSLDENLYFALIYSRWIYPDSWRVVKKVFFRRLPFWMKLFVPALVRRKTAQRIEKQGMSKHSVEEIKDICRKTFHALSDLLGDKKYFFGNTPCSLDATAYAFLAEFILAELDNPFNDIAKSYPVLVDYCKRIQTEFYPSEA